MMRMMRAFVAGMFSVALFATACTSSNAPPGDGSIASGASGSTTPPVAGKGLDPSFGTGGEVTTSISEQGDVIYALALQPDGKIVAAGSSGSNTEFALVRYDADGTLDTTFGDAGTVTTDFTTNGDTCLAVALQSDGKILAAGSIGFVPHTNPNFGIARYNLDGTLDTTFGDGGMVTTDLRPEPNSNGIAIQTDGKILAVGSSFDAGGESFALVRFNADGTPDTTFGSGGMVTTVFETNAGAHGVAIQPDGKIVVAGVTFASSKAGGAPGLAVARYDPDGALDPTFGDGGTVVTDLPGGAAAFRVAIQADGKILAMGGSAFSTGPEFTLVRYNADGSLDDGFGKHGSLVSKLLDPFGAFAIQPDGRVVAAGTDFMLVRFNADGTLDATFGTGGKLTSDFGPGFAATDVGAVAVQADGGILAAGSASLSKTDSDFALARYLAT
jgi:uncharacterized delta-60 repeat protein